MSHQPTIQPEQPSQVRYSITLTDRAGSKARYRTAMKLLGAEHVTISEKPVEASTPKPKKDNVPTSPEALAVAALFHRKPEQEWSDTEIALFRKATKTGCFTPENMKLITDYYQRERAKGNGENGGIHRRDLATFLRNASGELDRAKAVPTKPSRRLEWAEPAKIVPMPDAAEQERLMAEAKAGLAAFREGQRREA